MTHPKLKSRLPHGTFDRRAKLPTRGLGDRRRRALDVRRRSRRDVVTASLRHDMLEGADEIALFLFNDPKQKRRVYYMIQHGHLPTFRIGRRIYARRTALSEFLNSGSPTDPAVN